MTKEHSELNDSDMKNSMAALIRAAKSARKLAAKTGTEVVVRRDGKMIREYPKMSEFEEEADQKDQR